MKGQQPYLRDLHKHHTLSSLTSLHFFFFFFLFPVILFFLCLEMQGLINQFPCSPSGVLLVSPAGRSGNTSQKNRRMWKSLRHIAVFKDDNEIVLKTSDRECEREKGCRGELRLKKKTTWFQGHCSALTFWECSHLIWAHQRSLQVYNQHHQNSQVINLSLQTTMIIHDQQISCYKSFNLANNLTGVFYR